jgi:hypothetical protein
MFTTYNQSFHKPLQIQGESNWCTNTSQFAFINHFNPNISQHLQCLLKSQNTSPLILEIFFILHQTHTTKKTYNQWVSSRMVQTYINSTSRGTCCNSTNPKYNVVTWCKNTITWRLKKKLTCISIRKWVGFSSKTFGVFNFQVTFLLLGLYLNIWNQPCTIVVAFVSSNN